MSVFRVREIFATRSHKIKWVRQKSWAQIGRDKTIKREKTSIADKNVRGPNVPLLQYKMVDGKPTLSILHDNQSRNISRREEVDSYKENVYKRHSYEKKTNLESEYFNDRGNINDFLSPSDIYFSVRTSAQYHQTRLPLILSTWISLLPERVTIITDSMDKTVENEIAKFKERRPLLTVVDCPLYIDNKWALLCKTYWEYKKFFSSSNKTKWFCHFDDDSYVNIVALLTLLNYFDSNKLIYVGHSTSTSPVITRVYDTEVKLNKPAYLEDDNERKIVNQFTFASFYYAESNAGYCVTNKLAQKLQPFLEGFALVRTSASIALPDDYIIGYLITHLLNVSLVHADLLHTQADDLSAFSERDLLKQVTLGVIFSESALGRMVKNFTDSTASIFEGIRKFSTAFETSNFDFIRDVHGAIKRALDED